MFSLFKDIVQHRLNIAKDLGADCTLLIGKDDCEEDLVTKIHCELGCAPTISIDCCGMEKSLRLGILVSKLIRFKNIEI